ncbi:hypothetical protein [Brevundimonas subvibrioides]|uniref:hypothetical protein n=1 Tax=Brevundimonas subvibrioides TaxID=74313 RepID=UPI0022B51A90|nr:hypothetical protein [Brevundimonas subvibrioides]
MRFLLSALIMSLALSACATSPGPVPRAFHGTWDLSPIECGDPDGVSRLVIAGTRLTYYEWGGDVLSVRPDGDGSVQVDLNWWDTSDTDANDRPVIRHRPGKLTLSPDRSALRIAIDGEATTYTRCPGAPS